MSDEWGPWIEHDGRGCPIPKGTLGMAKLRDGRTVLFRALCGSATDGPYVRGVSYPEKPDCWTWDERVWGPWDVLEYRIRKPRGLTMLEQIAKGIREPADA